MFVSLSFIYLFFCLVFNFTFVGKFVSLFALRSIKVQKLLLQRHCLRQLVVAAVDNNTLMANRAAHQLASVCVCVWGLWAGYVLGPELVASAPHVAHQSSHTHRDTHSAVASGIVNVVGTLIVVATFFA